MGSLDDADDAQNWVLASRPVVYANGADVRDEFVSEYSVPRIITQYQGLFGFLFSFGSDWSNQIEFRIFLVAFPTSRCRSAIRNVVADAKFVQV